MEAERTAIPEPEGERIYIPHVTINPNYLVFWDKCITGYNYNSEGLKNNRHNGEMSAKASKRVRTIITWFAELTKDKLHKHQEKKIKYRLTFVTLTLPTAQVDKDGEIRVINGNRLTDEFIKRNLLNRFLQEMKRRYSVVNYFWRAEAQENGNIHFHITFDKFIFHAELRKIWNLICLDYGMIDEYRKRQKEFFKDGFRMSENKYDTRTEEQQRAAYERGLSENFSNPNTTDIHSIYKIGNIAGYLSKYVSKNLKVYEFKSDEQPWKIKKELSKIEGFISLIREANGFKAKFSAITNEIFFTAIEGLKTKLYDVRERVIRAINGRLWFCSRSLKQLKNITLELTHDVFCGINELMNSTPSREFIPQIKNKITGELTANRFVKVFVGDFLKISDSKFVKETDTHEAGLILSFIGSWYDSHIKPLLQKITGFIKPFFNTQQEELITE